MRVSIGVLPTKRTKNNCSMTEEETVRREGRRSKSFPKRVGWLGYWLLTYSSNAHWDFSCKLSTWATSERPQASRSGGKSKRNRQIKRLIQFETLTRIQKNKQKRNNTLGLQIMQLNMTSHYLFIFFAILKINIHFHGSGITYFATEMKSDCHVLFYFSKSFKKNREENCPCVGIKCYEGLWICKVKIKHCIPIII